MEEYTPEEFRECVEQLKESGQIVLAGRTSDGAECYVAREAVVGYTEMGVPIWEDNHGHLHVGPSEEAKNG